MPTATLAALVRVCIALMVRRFDAPLDRALAQAELVAFDALLALLPGVSAGRLHAIVAEHASTRAGQVTAYNIAVPPCIVARFALARRLDLALALVDAEPANDVAHADGSAQCVDCGALALMGLCDGCDRARERELRDAARG